MSAADDDDKFMELYAELKKKTRHAEAWISGRWKLMHLSCLDDRGLPWFLRGKPPRKSTAGKAPRMQLATKAQRTAAPWIAAEDAAKKAADAAAAAAKADDA